MATTQSAVRFFKDIRFWILFFFLLRMYGITFPPLEVGHNWRQTDGLMIARNFYERDANIFYPTVDVAGEKSGIVGCEFPLLNYIVYLVAAVFGYEHWYGRLVVLLFSSIGVFFFHRILRKYFGESVAFNAAIILLVSFWFSHSRKNIPDIFAVSLCITGLYYALAYLEEGKWYRLAIYFILALAGCLAKVTAASVLSVLLIPFLNKENPATRKVTLGLFSCAILAGIYGWYLVWIPYLNETYGFGDHFSMGTSFMEGAKSFIGSFPKVSKRFYDTAMKYTGFAAFLAGLFFLIRKKQWIAFAAFLLPFLSFMLVLIKTGNSIIGDTYYILTVIPCMAFVAGYGLAQIPNKKVIAAALVIIAIEGIADQIYDFRVRQPNKSLEELETIMDGISKRDDLIAINSDVHNPTAMYFAHRRGWTVTNDFLSHEENIQDMHAKGCKFIVIAKEQYGDISLAFPKVHESQYFKIYKLN
ncbi:MAG TPA: glycosyltransferase family 39 protein [Ohtaekwangia sp.]|uniref:ArnT family glycosyltransferase n=1 Tax=Ohtaekwangia sp. TaxID=2066019 RepID=UPI002F92DC4B